ncbi:hypothetical protein L1049_006270 [Liquidambar formosana]|uniref:Uncharacterized protein n=1 Tax=Liquidambar formosana TaxID=63359 RepID=A0AAP0RFN6_LIQFO
MEGNSENLNRVNRNLIDHKQLQFLTGNTAEAHPISLAGNIVIDLGLRSGISVGIRSLNSERIGGMFS